MVELKVALRAAGESALRINAMAGWWVCTGRRGSECISAAKVGTLIQSPKKSE